MAKFLQEGDIIEIVRGDCFYADIPKHFAYSNRKGDFTLTHHEVEVDKKFDYFIGRYVVTKTAMDGGGTGHGPGDVYPDGHHVWCESLEDEDRKLDFYQSGSFTCMMPDKKPVGKAKRKWSE